MLPQIGHPSELHMFPSGSDRFGPSDISVFVRARSRQLHQSESRKESKGTSEASTPVICVTKSSLVTWSGQVRPLTHAKERLSFYITTCPTHRINKGDKEYERSFIKCMHSATDFLNNEALKVLSLFDEKDLKLQLSKEQGHAVVI